MAVRSDAEWRETLEATAVTIRGCTRCRLHSSRLRAVPGEGPCPVTILLLGEAPGRDEDASGRPFVGRAGRVLDAALETAAIPRESVFITNVVKCRPPGNRRPRPDEATACRPYLLSQIACVRPSVIVTLGATALRSLMGPGLNLREVRGQRLEWAARPVVPTYHPAGVLYNRRLERSLRKDLVKVARLVRSGALQSEPRRPSGRTTSRGRATKRSRRPRS